MKVAIAVAVFFATWVYGSVPPVGLAISEITPSVILVEDLDLYIRSLVPTGYEGAYLRVKDTHTGSVYLIKKLK